MEFERRIASLRDVKQSAHFEVHFSHRNPKRYIGAGTGGVRSRALIASYIDALERLYSTMTNHPFSRPELPFGKPIKVYVFEISGLTQYDGQAFTDLDAELCPFIGLPCRTDLPTVHAEHQYASTSAVHEATHVFNHAVRPMHESQSWMWFDEATAVFMESWVFAGNHDHLRFAMNWSDLPEVPLDHPSHCYAAGIFVAYLVKSQRPEFLTRVWIHPDERATALDAIAAELLKDGKKLSSSDPNETDVLFSQYCVDSYFLWDNKSLGFWPDLYARYGERAITESVHVAPRDVLTPSVYGVDHLACRYFLLDLRDDVRCITATVNTSSADGSSFLRVFLATVKSDLSRGQVWPLTARFEGGNVVFSVGPVNVIPSELDHLARIIREVIASDSHCCEVGCKSR